MPRVKLGDVAREYKATVKDNAGFPIVGLEHLSPGEITLDCWDTDVETTFTKSFKKGHMLFGRRRAYLKKAALAPFDGVCSGDIIVIEAIPGKINPELLPFIIQNDLLFDYAVGNSSGSLSPRVKWESLKEYEFELPEISKQAELVDLLEAAYNTRKAYQQLIIACDELVKSQFIELFGDPEINPNGWYMPTVGEAVKDGYIAKPMDGNHGGKHPKGSDYVPSGIPFLMANNLIDGEADLVHCAFITKEQADSLDKGFAKDGDVLLTHKGTVGRTAILHCDLPYVMLTPQVTYYRPQKGISAEYLKAFFDTYYFQSELMKIASAGSTRAYIGITAQQNLRLIIPPIEQQNVFVSFVKQLDKSKFELKQAIANVSELMKSLIQQDFTN